MSKLKSPREKFGVQTEKGKVVYCFRNGDKHQSDGISIVVHPTKLKTFDQFKTTLSEKVGLVTGPVLRVYSSSRKPIKSLEELDDGGSYLCCGAEKINEDYLPPGFKDAAAKDHQAKDHHHAVVDHVESDSSSSTSSSSTSAHPSSTNTSAYAAHTTSSASHTTAAAHISPEKKPVVTSYVHGVPEKFGTQTEKGKIVYCFRNGDKHQSDGVQMLIHPTKIKTFDQFKTQLSSKIALSTGAVQKVYSASHKLIKSLDELEDHGKYLCCGAEKIDEDHSPVGLRT
eukprot:TRINITY_DN2853_c0_g2_i1.p1 TRINITY_DN2853_c0_g2~~TRINITY_DN2853_c0_g2_i1.p1  ORF type:complete len:284 (+),score=83.64 TRINITY_DN2853_c0_g2_i1:14-865(+)